MNRAGFYTMLASLTGVDAYPDYKPEDTALPAVTYSHITNMRNRDQAGGKLGLSDTWRVKIYAENREQIDTLLTQLETLDNSSNVDFSKVYVLSINDDTESEGDAFVTTFVDFKTTDR